MRPSVLVDSGADLLVYGQGEKPIVEIARRLASGEDVCGLVDVPGHRDRGPRPGDRRPRGAGPEDARAPRLRGGGAGQAVLRPFLEALPPRAQPRERPGDGAAARARGRRAARGGERAHAAAHHRGARRRVRAPLRARRAPELRRRPHPGAGADPLERGHPARLRRRLRLLLHHRAPGARRLLAQPRERDPGDRDPHEGPQVPRHHHRPGRRHRQHVADGLHQRRGPRRLPARLLRVPHRVPVLRRRPRAARATCTAMHGR